VPFDFSNTYYYHIDIDIAQLMAGFPSPSHININITSSDIRIRIMVLITFPRLKNDGDLTFDHVNFSLLAGQKTFLFLAGKTFFLCSFNFFPNSNK
jgi:hypothetical protein